MYEIDFKTPLHVHFIRIGGSAWAVWPRFFLIRASHITGSDAKESPLTIIWNAWVLPVFYGQRASNIQDGTDLVVYTAAIHPG